ncbi:MAG TPA: GAF domain-containing protein [Anaerolineae bacterium]|nr:GAF domain-containing protein [Anaerolineae bacterium]
MAMERMERPHGSVATRLRNPIVILVVLALLIVGGVSVYISRQAQAREIFRIQRRTAEQVAFSISTYLQSAKKDLSLFAQTQNLLALERSEQQSAIEQLWAQRQDIFDEITLVDQNGEEIAKVSRFHTFLPEELANQANAMAFQQAISGAEYLADEVIISSYSGLPVTEMAVPVREPDEGDIVGVLMAKVSIKHMWDVVAEVEVGESGYAYVIDTAGHLLAHTDLSRYLQLQTQDISHVPVVQTVLQGLAGPTHAEEYTGLESAKVVGAYTQIGGTSWFAIVELPTEEAYASVRRMMLSLLGFLSVVVLVIGGVSSWLPRRIIRPLEQLEEGAALLGSGQLDHHIAVHTGDELEALANAFNSMAAQLRELIENLEQRVAERTHDYEEAVVRTQQAYVQLHEAHKKLEATTRQAQRRAMQLETAAEVSRAATSVLDPDELVRQAVDLIRDRFNLYYAGLFLLDESGRWAVLRAGTGEPGRQMLKAGHKLEVGGRSMVGWCTANARARIALDVGEEAVRFDNPLLPETRSEMALPLISRGRVIGALDVQSVEAGAFSDEDISVLQTMADQIAVAIDNAHLFTEAQARLAEVQAAHRSYLQASWDEFLPTRAITSYEYVHPGVPPLRETTLPEIEQAIAQQRTMALSRSGDGDGGETQAQSALVAPITLRGQVIGALGLQEAEGTRQWTADEIALVEAVADQMALAIENARLFEETQRRLQEITTLYEASQACLSISDQESLLAAIIEAAARTTGASLGSVMLVDEKRGEYIFGATYGMSEETVATIKTELHIPLEEGLVGTVVTTGRPLVVADVNTDPRWVPFETKEPMRSFLGVPLVSRDGRSLGAITLSHPEVGAFDENHARLLSTFANQAALAIENARLFEEAQARARRERLIHEITGKVQRSIDLDAILQTTVQELGKALGVSRAVVRLGTEAELATPPAEGQADSNANQ